MVTGVSSVVLAIRHAVRFACVVFRHRFVAQALCWRMSSQTSHRASDSCSFFFQCFSCGVPMGSNLTAGLAHHGQRCRLQLPSGYNKSAFSQPGDARLRSVGHVLGANRLACVGRQFGSFLEACRRACATCVVVLHRMIAFSGRRSCPI